MDDLRRMSVMGLIDCLENLRKHHGVADHYTIEVWVRDHNGAESQGIAAMVPDIDHTEEFVAFKLVKVV